MWSLSRAKTIVLRALLVLPLVLASANAKGEPDNSFAAFLAALWPDAEKEGITRATFDTALAGLTPDAGVIAARRRQPEYGKPFGAYLASLVSPGRVAVGLRKSAQWAATLRDVDKKFGVDPSILVSIWGIESSYGDAAQRWDVFRSLATLAQARFHHPLFRDELLSALKILQDQHIPRQEFVGSWAGAMGQAQFLPSSFLKYAVDFDGDGQADIWRSVPDVLASIANYVQKTGWQRGMPWGFEVTVPPGFNYRTSRGTFAEWAQRGVRRADGSALPAAAGGVAIMFFPSGAAGPAFLVTDNFIVLKRFNNSDAYALAVGALSDRVRGLPPIRQPWPVDDVQPSRDQRIALQHRLAQLGYTVAEFEGHLDFDLRDAVRDLQQRYGMVPDGYPSHAFLDRAGVR
jgi:lytic murein transglycosylase